MNVIINEFKKNEKGKRKIVYYNLERRCAYTLKFGVWTGVPPLDCKEVKQRFDTVKVASMIKEELAYYSTKLKRYNEIISRDTATIDDKNEYTRIVKTLHYLNNWTL